MGNTAPYVRKATYAGRLYDADHDKLSLRIQAHLNEAANYNQHEPNHKNYPEGAFPDDEVNPIPVIVDTTRPIRALVAPHSFRQSRQARIVTAFAYQHLNPVSLASIQTILVLHPHHFIRNNSKKEAAQQSFAPGVCLLSNARELETPLGNLTVDEALRQELLSLNTSNNIRFQLMTREIDEQEHSGELQFIWLAHCLKLAFRLDSCRVLPVMLGDLKTSHEIEIGNLLRPIVNRPSVLTVISTEFCQWGRSYNYQPWDTSMKPHEFVAKLDWHGIRLVQNLNAGAFAAYLLETDNPISGRHALAVWMRAAAASALFNNSGEEEEDVPLSIVCTKYAQSFQCQTLNDWSVSYAAIVATRTPAVAKNHDPA